VPVDTTSISIHNLVLNENPLDIIKKWDINAYIPEGCNDPTACNYNPNTVSSMNEVCEYPGEEDWPGCDCYGNVLDECGECGGSGIPDGQCDCDGNVADCAGDCGGAAVNDECGDCNGDGPDMCWDGSYECDASDCPDQPGGSVDVHYNSDTPIAGFQFHVAGVDVTGAGGGAAEAAGFTVSTGNNTVLGFSLQAQPLQQVRVYLLYWMLQVMVMPV